MKFIVTAVDGNGARRRFRRDAASSSALLAALKSEGLVALSVVADAGDAPGREPSRKPRISRFGHFLISRFQVEMGLRQIAAMLRSGVTLLVALETVADQAMGKTARRLWLAVAESIEKGDTLSSAFAAYSRCFGEIAVRLADVGERTGELAHTLMRAADQMEARRNLRTMVINALAYPFLAVAMAVGVSVYLVAIVIPKLAEFLTAGGVQLPAITMMLMDISAFMTRNGVEILSFIAIFAVVWWIMRIFSATRELQDALLLRLPVTGKIMRLSGTAMFSRAMQIMTESGVTLIDSLETASKLLTNSRLRRRIDQACAGVIRGKTLDDALKSAVEFMPMMRRMAAVGEVSGSLPDAFGETARFHEMLLAIAVKRFGILIEPVMICITGLIVGFVYIAFFVALFSMAGTH